MTRRCLMILCLLMVTYSSRGEDSADFVREVHPLLKTHCLKCHGEQKQKGGLRLDLKADAFKGGDSGKRGIEPGNSGQSRLLQLVTSKDPAERMPPGVEGLNATQIDVLRRWIDAGAQWPDSGSPAIPGGRAEMVVTAEDRLHWSFLPLRTVELPAINQTDEVRSPIDRFIRAALEARKLSPTPSVEPRKLIRRIYFDVLGLPPTPEEIDTFCAAASRDQQSAVTELIDRLLESRHYGERWARHWLDVVRYADSDGMEEDFDRPYAYQYRDFVIRSLNDDLPFNTFVKWQIAGDELDPDNPLAVAATGFLVAGPHAVLPEKLLEEERLFTKYNELDDVISTLGTGLLGLTLACARCHDHKYDPLPTRDYYRLMAALHSGDRTVVPLGPRTEVDAYRQRRSVWQQAVNAAESQRNTWLQEQKTALVPGIRAVKIAGLSIGEAEKSFLKDQPDSDEAKKIAKQHEKSLSINDRDLRTAMNDEQRRRWDELTKAIGDARSREPVAPPSGYVFKDLGAVPKTNWLFRRGDFRDREIPVKLGFLSVLTNARTPDDYWQTAKVERPLPDSTYQRKALAEWIVDVDQGAGALLARVIVNRVWQHHFGAGLVATVNDFGARGDPPSHPELLEWLTQDFVAHGWQLKRLHRLILRSAAWQQGTAFNASQAQADPDNRLLWRRRPQRIEAEILRDSMLAISGSLNLQPYGPGFKPPIASEAMTGRNVKDPYPTNFAETAAVRRRSVYMFHKRLTPIPLLQAFDKPDAQQGCGRRDNTTVAPQALALLNDQFVRDRAFEFADRLLAVSSDDAGRWIDTGYQLALGRPPRDSERKAAVAFLEAQSQRRGQRDAKAASAQVRRDALADLCQTLFSLNEFIYVD